MSLYSPNIENDAWEEYDDCREYTEIVLMVIVGYSMRYRFVD